MLATFRKGAQHIVVRGFLFLLAAMFVLWGVGDVFRGRSSHVVASVGGSPVTTEEFSNQYRQELRRFQAMTGNAMTEEQIAKFGIKQQILQQLIDRQLVIKRIDDLGITVGNEAVAWQLQTIPAFQDDKGRFDRQKFLQALQHTGTTEKSFIDSEKQESSVSLLLSSLLTDPAQTDLLTKTLYAYQNEKRVIDLVTVPAGFPVSTPEPTEEDLIQYYQEHVKEFVTPESRSVSYITLTPSSVKKEFAISEEDLKKEYDSRAEEYSLPEQRKISQYLFDDAAKAEKAYAALNAGQHISGKLEEIGNVTKDSLPAELQEAVFQAANGQYTKPVKTDLGVHIVKIDAITPAGLRSFAEVKDELKKHIEEEKKSSRFYEFSQQLEDDIAAGGTLESIAKKYELPLTKIKDLTKSAKDSNGKDIALPDTKTFIGLVFGLDTGIESSLTQIPDSDTYIIAKVDNIQPERTRALDEVKGSAIVLWKEQQKKKQYADIAEKARQQIRSGNTIESVAGQMHLILGKGKIVSRPSAESASDKEIPAALLKEAFSVKKGEVTHVHPSDTGAFVIARVSAVIDASGGDKEGITRLQQQMQSDAINEALQQYSSYLRSLYPVEIHDNVLKSM